jgi:hypothetical protein
MRLAGATRAIQGTVPPGVAAQLEMQQLQQTEKTKDHQRKKTGDD